MAHHPPPYFPRQEITVTPPPPGTKSAALTHYLSRDFQMTSRHVRFTTSSAAVPASNSASSSTPAVVVAFATFVNRQSAMAALHSLNGVKFDPQTGSSLHIELARSNSRRKNKPGSGTYIVIDKRTNLPMMRTKHQVMMVILAKLDDPSRPNDLDSGNKDDSAVEKSEVAADADNAVAPESEQVGKTVDGTQACSTLFIANLGPLCTEDELKQALARYPGFNSLKLGARGGMPAAFADFEGVEQASEAINALPGSPLQSSDRGGMHIEHAF